MKKVLIVSCAIAFLVLCFSWTWITKSNINTNNENLGNRQLDLPVHDTLNIEKFALEFLKEHPDINNNDITRKEAQKDFETQIKELIKSDSLLKGVPVELRHLKQDQTGKYTAHFWSAYVINAAGDLIEPFRSLNFDYCVNGVPEEIARTINERDKYLLDVHYLCHIDNISTFKFLTGDSDWGQTEEINLSPISFRRDPQEYSINLGLMFVDFISVEPYTE